MADKGVGIERPNMGVAAGKSSVLHPLFPLFKYLTPSLNKKIVGAAGKKSSRPLLKHLTPSLNKKKK